MIELGAVVYSLLSSNETLQEKIGTKIFPLIIPYGTVAPAIFYERNGNGESNKDSGGLFDSTVDITIISNTYSEGIDIAKCINSILDGYRGRVLDVNVRKITFENIYERYSEANDMCVQRLSYNFKTN